MEPRGRGFLPEDPVPAQKAIWSFTFVGRPSRWRSMRPKWIEHFHPLFSQFPEVPVFVGENGLLGSL